MEKLTNEIDHSLRTIENTISEILTISENYLYQENISLDSLNTSLIKRKRLIEKLKEHEEKVKTILNKRKYPDIERRINDLKKKIKQIEEIDIKVLNILKGKKEKIIKEISKVTDINSRRYNSLKAKGVKPKFIDLKQR